MASKIRYKIHYLDYDLKHHAITYTDLASARSDLNAYRADFKKKMLENGMKFNDGSNCDEETLEWFISDMCIEEIVTKSTRLPY